MKSIYFFLCWIFCHSSLGAVTLDQTHRVVITTSNQTPSSSSFNPRNQILKTPELVESLQYRPDLKLSDEIWFLQVRPRAQASRQQIDIGRTDKTEFWINESDLSLSPTPSAQIHLGRQNYQWGPGEMLSPTQFFYPGLLQNPDPNFEVYGLTQARINWSFGFNWNIVTLVELDSLKDYEGSSLETSSQQRKLVKGEWSSETGDLVAGGVLGTQNNEPQSGLYGLINLSQSLQLYTDTLLKKESLTSSDLQVSEKSGFFSLTGVRYTFENGEEVRLEWIHNDFGQSQKSQLAWAQSSSWALPIYWSQRKDSPLAGVDYLYLSCRISDMASTARSQWLLRGLHSLTDQSTLISGSYERGFGEHWTTAIFGAFSIGDTDSEWKRTIKDLIGLSLKWTL